METLENPWGKTENCMKVHHWTWDCNGIYKVESCGTNMSLSKNMYCWEDCQQSAGQLALGTSSCGSALWLCAVPKPSRVSSESRSKKTTEKNMWHQVRNPLLRRVWNLCLTCFQCLFLCGRSLLAPGSFDPRSSTGIWLPTKWITLKLGEFLQCQFYQFCNDL